MSEYHKINSIFKRDMSLPHKPIIDGSWTCQEFEYLANSPWVFTEKVDGTNIRVTIQNGGEVTFGGRTDTARIPAGLLDTLNSTFLSEQMSSRLSTTFSSLDTKTIVLYGEGYGAGIQKHGGRYHLGQEFVLFDVRIGGWWLQRSAVEDIATKLTLAVVPVIGAGTLFDAIRIVKRGLRSRWGDFTAEGIVARPAVELQNRAGERIITKIKHVDFQHTRSVE